MGKSLLQNDSWKEVTGCSGLYQVSDKGRIRNAKSGKILKPTDNGNGYLIVRIAGKNRYVHRIVAESFLQRGNGKNTVNHKDYNKNNNNVNNLEWVTQKENVNYSAENMRKPKGVTHSNTGEKYITYRKSKGVFRVTVNRKEIGNFKTLDEAITKRDEILKGVV